MKEVFLKISQNSQENTCARVSFLIKLQIEACNFIKKEALAWVFSFELCELFKITSGGCFYGFTPRLLNVKFRSSHLDVIYKKVILKHFTIF